MNELKLIATSFGTYESETGQNFLKTNSGKLIPLDNNTGKISNEKHKKQCTNFYGQQASQVNLTHKIAPIAPNI